MKKLLYLINSLDTGGAQKGMVRICSHLRHDYDIRVVGLLGGDRSIVPELADLSIASVDLGFRRGIGDVTRFARVNSALADFEPDILVCSLYHSSVLGAWYGWMHRTPRIISWEHSGYLGGFTRRAVKRLIDRAVWKVFCDSRAVYNEYTRRIGRQKAVHVPIGGVDTSVFVPRDTPPRDGVVGVSVGRLERIKGYDLLVDSAKKIMETHRGFRIRIAATGSEESVLRERIEAAGLSDRISLEGRVDDIPAFLAAGDLYLQPSRAEGQCVAVIEAMACGLPVLGASAGGIVESVSEGENGFLADPADATEWNAGLERLIEDRSLRTQMGRRSRELAVERHDIRRTVERVRAELEGGEVGRLTKS
jgi:glycosyltransferase involved in cell wall biosynthesis